MPLYMDKIAIKHDFQSDSSERRKFVKPKYDMQTNQQ